MATTTTSLIPSQHKRLSIPFLRTSKTRVAMSLLEVFLGLSVLSVGILGSMSVMTTLNDFRRSTEDQSIAYATADQIAQQLRVSIGGNLAPWQEHRRATTLPLSGEEDAKPNTEADLIAANILTEPTGLANMEVFIEYYSDRLVSELASIMEANLIDNPTMNARSLWLSAVGIPSSDKNSTIKQPPTLKISGVAIGAINPPIILPRKKVELEALLSQTNSKPLSVLIRVLVSWQPANAPENTRQWSEATVAYRP